MTIAKAKLDIQPAQLTRLQDDAHFLHAGAQIRRQAFDHRLGPAGIVGVEPVQQRAVSRSSRHAAIRHLLCAGLIARMATGLAAILTARCVR